MAQLPMNNNLITQQGLSLQFQSMKELTKSLNYNFEDNAENKMQKKEDEDEDEENGRLKRDKWEKKYERIF